MKLLSLSLLFAASVLADKKITYSCYNKHGGVNKTGNNESKAGGSISDDLAEKLLEHMPAWSEHKYEAKQNRHNKTLVTVVCKEKAENKDKALEAIAEQQKIVGEHKDD
jgi:hypothetical protein